MRLKGFIASLIAFSLIISFSLLAQTQKPVDPINWRELIPFLIDIPDWEAEGDAEGQTVSMANFKITEAERSYTAGERDLEIQIIDSGYVQMAYAGIKMAMSYEVDSSDEYSKKITIKGFPGIEKYEYEYKEAEVIILVADRFVVTLTGDNFEDTKELKEIANLLDLEKLASLAK